ncbi:TM2 domain-containing protein [Halovivax cerinus]|uniref:TM2 domain-containing protein n=1 Tax=Halovivax cerinus TaxID=1487865 RepID=A0ABD5NKY9_9EURY|nr:TM2 domain-containing protein [Halovivax cerinus]
MSSEEEVSSDTPETGSDGSDDGSTGSSPTKGPDEVFCSSCGNVIKEDAEICPDCGVRQKRATTVEKNPGLAAAASFLWTGLGQVYNGQIGKGIGFIVLQMVNVLLMFVLIGLITFPLTWIYGIYDAYKTAEKINEGKIEP